MGAQLVKEVATKTDVEYTDSMAQKAVGEAKLTVFDAFQMYSRMAEEKAPAKFYKRFWMFKTAMEKNR